MFDLKDSQCATSAKTECISILSKNEAKTSK